MKRATLLLALSAVVGAGCYSKPDRGDVTLYWDFVRHKFDGTTVAYDTAVTNANPNSAICAQSQVDFVVVTFPDGSAQDVDCVFQGVQGATFSNFIPGTNQFVITGYRQVGNTSVALYESTVAVNIIAGQTVAPPTVDVEGIPGDLEVDVTQFLNPNGTVLDSTTCAGAGVATLTFHLVDIAGTSVAIGNVPCTDPTPGVSFLSANKQALDLDDYSIRMQAFASDGTTVFFDSSSTFVGSPACAAPAFSHYDTDVGTTAWPIKLYDVRGVATCP